MISVLIAVIWAGVAVYAIRVAESVVREWTPNALAAVKAAPVEPPIPDDLLALAASETETWAQEELVRVIQEKYEVLKDWNRVRSAMGIGILPDEAH